MAVKRYVASKDNTITNAFNSTLLNSQRGTGSNMGAADVLEVFSIYGESSGSDGLSAELSRIILEFPIDSITTDRTAGTIPASGSVSFYLNLYNTKHAFTLPRNFNLVIQPISTPHSPASASWEEGPGLDMEEYKDKTYNNSGSNWIQARMSSANGLDDGKWATPGGDYYQSTAYHQYNVSFPQGYEDLEVDISGLVEDWIAGTISNRGIGIRLTASQEAKFDPDNDTAATAVDAIDTTGVKTANVDSAFSFTIPTSAGGEGGATTIRLSAGQSTAPPVAGAGSSIGIGFSDKTDAELAALIINAINAVATTNIVFAVSNNGMADYDSGITAAEGSSDTQITLTIDTPGTDGNLTTAIASTLGTDIVDVADFTGGAAQQNTGSQNSLLYNPTGSTESYYTKKFFARSSEFFFKRPIIEARWDSRTTDNRGNFYLSSALAPEADNLNTLYLYNYIRGKLTDLPGLQDQHAGYPIWVSIYSGSAAPTGSRLLLPAGGGVDTANDTQVTGGWVSTGLYTASFALTGTLSKAFDVWHLSGTVFATSSFAPLPLNMYDNAPTPEYVTAISNMKSEYKRSETGRFRLFIRNKNWSPTIYTVSQADNPTETLTSASYQIFRVSDDLAVIPYGTGSDKQTYLSYDVSGNYFDLEMSMLQSGFAYGLTLAYYNDSIADWVQQPEVFKFRVEKD